MEKILIETLALNLFGGITCINEANAAPTFSNISSAIDKLDIIIKNDIGDEISVINDGSGGSYRLQKNLTTAIKMEPGDKLYIYKKGKKGKLLLIASANLDGKVQLLSKL
jgi:hypothetical protein